MKRKTEKNSMVEICPIRNVVARFELSETGLSLVPIIRNLTDWAMQNMKSIMKHREMYESM